MANDEFVKQFAYLAKKYIRNKNASDEPIDGWNDWFFGIDCSNASLFGHCPAQ